MTMKHLLLTLMLLTGLTGCSVYTIDSKDTTLEFYPPKTSIDQVQYLETVNAPNEEIGVVTVTTERRQPYEEVLAKLKQEAAILGGDAITDVKDVSKKYYIRNKYTAKVLVLK
jgi:hypothetical protein